MSTEANDLIRDVQALVAALPCGPQPRTGTVLIQAGTKLEARLRDVLGAPVRLRRTRVGRWVIDGRTYRTRALALASVQDRFMAPLWSVLLGYTAVLPGEIRTVTIEGSIAL